jgi:hypothetical protein
MMVPNVGVDVRSSAFKEEECLKQCVRMEAWPEQAINSPIIDPTRIQRAVSKPTGCTDSFSRTCPAAQQMQIIAYAMQPLVVPLGLSAIENINVMKTALLTLVKFVVLPQERRCEASPPSFTDVTPSSSAVSPLLPKYRCRDAASRTCSDCVVAVPRYTRQRLGNRNLHFLYSSPIKPSLCEAAQKNATKDTFTVEGFNG